MIEKKGGEETFSSSPPFFELALLILQDGYTGGNIFIYSRFVSLGAIAVFLFLSLFIFFYGASWCGGALGEHQ
jgi:hypothetical protein